mmetsp:Transcript_17006/g.42593  ORF Transcript_17006/g.42593 Transcript_17006/m.42593 type:complete len:403 (-) Transcript_17006:565-1773(-)
MHACTTWASPSAASLTGLRPHLRAVHPWALQPRVRQQRLRRHRPVMQLLRGAGQQAHELEALGTAHVLAVVLQHAAQLVQIRGCHVRVAHQGASGPARWPPRWLARAVHAHAHLQVQQEPARLVVGCSHVGPPQVTVHEAGRMDGCQSVQQGVRSTPQPLLVPRGGSCVWQAHRLQHDCVLVIVYLRASHSMHQPLGTGSGLVHGSQLANLRACPACVQGPGLDALLHHDAVRAEVQRARDLLWRCPGDCHQVLGRWQHVGRVGFLLGLQQLVELDTVHCQLCPMLRVHHGDTRCDGHWLVGEVSWDGIELQDGACRRKAWEVLSIAIVQRRPCSCLGLQVRHCIMDGMVRTLVLPLGQHAQSIECPHHAIWSQAAARWRDQGHEGGVVPLVTFHLQPNPVA